MEGLDTMKLILTVISGLPEECYDQGIRVQESEILTEMGFDEFENAGCSLEEVLEREHPGAKFWRDSLASVV